MKIELGQISGRQQPDNGSAAIMDVEELIATRLLVQGNSGSGKSHLLRRLLEQSAPLVQQVIIDPEGDFVSLSETFGHVVIDANRSPKELEVLARRVRESKVSCVLNLESLEVSEQMTAAGIFLNGLFDAPREHWYPVLVVVDEAQLFAPSASGDASDDARRVSLAAMTNLMCRGRKRGLCGIIATQRLAKLAKNVAAEASNFLMGRTFLDIDMARAVDLLGMDKKDAEKFRDLGRGAFIALGPALYRRPMPIQVGGVVTHARGSTPKLTTREEMSLEDATNLVLAPVDTGRSPVERRQATMQAAPEETDALLAVVGSIADERKAEDLETAPDAPVLDRIDARAVYRRVAADLMTEPGAHMRSEAALYQDFQSMVRIQRLGIPVPELTQFKGYLSVARAGVPVADMGQPQWVSVLRIAVGIDEDLRSVYLLMAKAAIQSSPCPPDATIARICGIGSPRRASLRLSSLEKGGFLVVKIDMRQQRSVLVPDISMETLPAAPDGHDVIEAVVEDVEQVA